MSQYQVDRRYVEAAPKEDEGLVQQQLLPLNPSAEDHDVEIQKHSRSANADSPVVLVAWFGLNIVCNVLWGLYLVDTRYLQRVAEPPLEAFRLTFYISALSLLSTLFFYTLPRKLLAARAASRSDASQPLLEAEVADPVKVTFLQRAQAIVVVAASVGTLALCQVWCTNFTSASFAQLIFMTSPLFVALMSSAVLRLPIPRRLLPTLAVIMAGSALTIFGASQSQGGYALSYRDGIGMGMAFVAVLGQAVYYVMIQKTRGLLDEDTVMYTEYITMCLTMPILSGTIEPRNWQAILHYGGLEWGSLIFASVVVYFGANLMQQYIIRRLGASLFSMAISTRLIASIAGSWLLLGERISGPIEWSGVAVVFVAITYYLWFQYRLSTAQGQQQGARPGQPQTS